MKVVAVVFAMIFSVICVVTALHVRATQKRFKIKATEVRLTAMYIITTNYSGYYDQLPSYDYFSGMDTNDMWGTPITYRILSQKEFVFELISAGPDMRFGTGDDIKVGNSY